MLRASIDIGSNSTLLLIADVNDNQISRVLSNEANVTSLGKDLDVNKAFIESSMNDTFNVLKEYKKIVESHNIDPKNVIATATEASRVAQNSESFYQKVKNETGFEVQIITSDGEAHYTALGVVSLIKQTSEKFVVMDIGGASTELINIQREPFKRNGSVSLPVGAVRATDWLANGDFDLNLEKVLLEDLTNYQTDNLICVAGSMTTLGAMFLGKKVYEDDVVNGTQIAFNQFVEFVNKIKNMKPNELLDEYPFLGKRAPFIVGGALMCLEIAKNLNIKSFEISTSGLRYGTILAGAIDVDYLNR